MLKRLWLKNFILADAVEISLQKGFNVITGETGSGKSIMLASLSFVLGEKADASIIRHGAPQATVEAIFELKKKNSALIMLEEAGISVEDEELIIKRDISENGKSRLFINHQSVTGQLVRKIAPFLIEFCGQHTTTKLMDPRAPLEMLDLYGDLEEQKSQVRAFYHRAQEIQKKLRTLEERKPERARAMTTCLREIEEINEVNVQEGEEETLFQEFSRLQNMNEIKTRASEFMYGLEESKIAPLQQLVRLKGVFQTLEGLDESVKETLKAYTSAVLELQEVGYEMKRYVSRLSAEPERHAKVEARLKKINELKRKFGDTIQEIEAYRDAQEAKLKELELEEASIAELKEEAQIKAEESKQLSQALSKARKTVSTKFAAEIMAEIQSLNMPHAIFEVNITDKEPSQDGIDAVQFFFTPNLGEMSMNVAKASGGELARLMLAFYCILSSKTDVPTIFFDEIDANIGGTTATQVAEKLTRLGASHQIISITHFAQVAKAADCHLVISKEEREGRTYSSIKSLTSDKARLEELRRMMGGTLEFKRKVVA